MIRGGGVLRRKNLQISDLQRLASLYYQVVQEARQRDVLPEVLQSAH